MTDRVIFLIAGGLIALYVLGCIVAYRAGYKRGVRYLLALGNLSRGLGDRADLFHGKEPR